MICPYCGKEMTLGYIYGDRYRIKWISKENDHGSILTCLSKGIILTDFVENKLEVYHCEDDEVFIIKK